MIDQSILDRVFKAFDIRGLEQGDLTGELFFRLGQALAIFTGAKKLAVGRDVRPMSENYAKAARAGIVSVGGQALDIGLVPIEVVYSTVGLGLAEAGLMVTASHNPAGFNGAKLIGEKAISITADSGLLEIKDLINGEPKLESSGEELSLDPWPGYFEKVFSVIDRTKILPKKLLVDAGNGIAGLLVSKLKERFKKLEIRPLFFEPDGRFPNHEANPIKEENRRLALEAFNKESAVELIAWFDGDADRIVFGDDLGRAIPSDFTAALIVEELIRREPDSSVVVDPRRGLAIRETVSNLGGEVLVAKAGYPSIKSAMRERDAIFGFESSAHHFYRDFFFSDSSLISLLLILEIVSEREKPLSDLVEPFFERFFLVEEENFRVKKPEKLFQRLESLFAGGEISRLDGLSISFPDWHFNLRQSQTEDFLRFNIEAKSPAALSENQRKIRDEIANFVGLG